MRPGIVIKNNMFSELYGTTELRDIERLIRVYREPMSVQQIMCDPSIMAESEILMTEWGNFCFDADMLEHLPNLKAVFYAGGSIRGITTEAFWDRDIIISSAYGANAVSVAQYAVAQILAGVKRAWPYAQRVKAARNYTCRNDFAVPGTYNTTLGIVSLGMIAWHVCKYIQAITEMKIIAYDPYVSEDQAAAMNVSLCSLEDVFIHSDVVSVHTPMLDETAGMLQGKHFEAMRPNASFINTARGGVVKEAEMIEVLKRRPDILAVLDVTDPEPPELESPLYDLDNVFLTPHIAGCMGPECIRMGRYMVEELERYVTGKQLKWQITRQQATVMA